MGQYYGFILLVLFSLLGAFGVLFVSKAWSGLLGLFPIYLGVEQIIEQYKVRKEDDLKEEDELENISESRFSG